MSDSFTPEIVPLNVDRLQEWIDQGRLDTSKPITIKELHESRCLHGVKDGVKLLARVRKNSCPEWKGRNVVADLMSGEIECGSVSYTCQNSCLARITGSHQSN